MAKLDYAKAKADIAEIVEIVKTVPDALQQRCFELLFEAAFATDKVPSSGKSKEPETAETQKGQGDQADPPSTIKKLPANVLAFMHRQKVARDEIAKLFMLEHDPLLQIYKIPTGNTAKSQLIKVMMVLLENGLLNNALTASYAELRESVKEDGFYDKNFQRMLRSNHGLFRGAISEESVDEDGVVELTGSGMERLAEIVKELVQ